MNIVENLCQNVFFLRNFKEFRISCSNIYFQKVIYEYFISIFSILNLCLLKHIINIQYIIYMLTQFDFHKFHNFVIFQTKSKQNIFHTLFNVFKHMKTIEDYILDLTPVFKAAAHLHGQVLS